ncbi:hypothetical protein Tco_0826984, partial [Tanacetum coccineum]
ESVKREEEFEIKKPVLRYTKRKYLARKGLQKKPESAKSGTEEDVEAYMEERVDEPSSEEFPMADYQDWKESMEITGLKKNMKGFYGGDLKTMFDPPSKEDVIWKLPHQQQILNWRYFHSCNVHCLTVEAAHIYMLTEVKYPLPPRVCKAMLEKKLLGDRKDVVWNLTHQQKILSWRYFHSCVVHCLTLEAAHIYMLTEVKYPLSSKVCQAMLEKKLIGDRKDKSTMSNRHKDWLVQEQTALGKDFSNPFMADNLPKIIWLSTHHIYVCKELACPQGYGLS